MVHSHSSPLSDPLFLDDMSPSRPVIVSADIPFLGFLVLASILYPGHFYSPQ
ncbi:hypothetical protein K439DRAFT_1626196 [Ramaria rubella]|nr:hypothetical protein K439DRAFT_1626196 [Ramaria rubella]